MLNYLHTYLLTCLHTYLLHGAESFMRSFQLVKKFPTFYGTRRFSTAITSTRHLSLPLANFLAAAVSEPALHRLLTFQVPNLMSLFRCLGCTKVSVQVRGSCNRFVKDMFLRRGVVSTSPNPQAGGPPLVGCPRLLIQYIRSYPSYWRPFLHPQPEDAPCCGDRDPFITVL